MLKREGIRAQVGPVPGVVGEKASFGLMAAQALQDGKIDAFWANGMGAEIAVRNGVGSVVLDVRRDGSDEWKGYTFPALVARADIDADTARMAIRAVTAAHDALKKDPGRATANRPQAFPAGRGRSDRRAHPRATCPTMTRRSRRSRSLP
jgi:ABC-type nitrate/sulfonate/bicarbonate transport system substrate-binding protein